MSFVSFFTTKKPVSELIIHLPRIYPTFSTVIYDNTTSTNTSTTTTTTITSTGFNAHSANNDRNFLKLKSMIMQKDSKIHRTFQHLSNNTNLLPNTLTNYFTNNYHHFLMTLGFLILLLCIIAFMIYSWIRISNYFSKMFLFSSHPHHHCSIEHHDQCINNISTNEDNTRKNMPKNKRTYINNLSHYPMIKLNFDDSKRPTTFSTYNNQRLLRPLSCFYKYENDLYL
ncbi:unnamed protein product [Rotaria socialis]|uniref:Uncharacterized protein n=1 Tax=Rotaria socialis TaxID=392032 RepID=A0A821UJ64_9BILA|nr:unnamed protein product [Rotaria socialis]CAF4890898.1 unnamed protein product [Rotaria socialis]